MSTDSDGALSEHRESYVAVVSLEDVDGLTRALADVGIERDAIDIFEDANIESAELAPESADDSTAKQWVRKFFGFDQVEVERIYVQALEAGEAVVRVRVPEDDVATRAEAEKTLLDHDGRFIHYFGKWSYVEVAAAADRAGDRTT